MMKCIYCGEELKEGSLYCPKCGKAVQIVPDYNIYDDDYLNQVLTEESQKISGSRPDRNKKPAPAETKHPGKKHLDPRQKKIIFLVLGIVCVLIFALLILGAAIRSNHANSFDYQVGLAEKMPVLFGVLTTENIEQAIARAGSKGGNKGYDCALSAIEMVNLMRQF